MPFDIPRTEQVQGFCRGLYGVPSPQKGGGNHCCSRLALMNRVMPPFHSSSLLTQAPYLFASVSTRQIKRFNAMGDERARKLAAGQALPPTVDSQLKSGELKLPWTNAK